MKKRSSPAHRAVVSHLRAMLRALTASGEQLETLRVLLARQRRRAVTITEAQRFFDQAAQRWRDQANARNRVARSKRNNEGRCTRCKSRPARPNRTTCKACAENAKAAIYAKRAAAKAGSDHCQPEQIATEASLSIRRKREHSKND
jgi:hypothetical protein